MRAPSRLLLPRIVLVVVALAASAATIGCGGKTTTTSRGQTSSTLPADKPADPATQSDAASQIPPGRALAEGGGGPVQYTFREEWRRALPTAQEWRSGAYLITATGDQINNEGVPSSWRLLFIDRKAADSLLMVDMDPWGKVTDRRELTGEQAKSFVGDYTEPIPFSVIDSDQVVELGRKKLAETYNLGNTKDPRVGLNFGETGGGGPYWVFTVFDNSDAEYVSARVDAITGEIVTGK